MKTEIELFENALDTASVNGKKLREYINENYISNSILDKIRAEIEHHRRKTQSIDPYDLVGDCLDIIDKYKAERGETKMDELDFIQPKKVVGKLISVDVLDKIRAEINSPNRGTCDYFIVDRIEEIIDKYKAESEEV